MKAIYLSLLLVGTCFYNLNSQTSTNIMQATRSFIETLTADQREATIVSFDDPHRTKWTNLPIGLAERTGIQYGALSERSKIQFHQILTTLLSSQGYLKTTSIMQLDDILNQVYATAFERKLIDQSVLDNITALKWAFNNYFLAIWNTPDPSEPWGLKFEGHHISINLSVVGDEVSVAPLFFGTDPAEVEITKYAGIRVLSKEEDYGMQLINMLTSDQRAVATISKQVPGDIITNPNSPQRISKYEGIAGADMTIVQKEHLLKLIHEYSHNLEYEKANSAMDAILKSGVDAIYFSWIGSYERHKPHYYRVHGPDFLIEYDNVGFQKDGNHIHTIWRETGKDFGDDILKKHYLEHKH